jgi:hypothetical protein
MDEIPDLIRLLAEAPMEEPPMSRPKDLLDRMAVERVVKEGVNPAGPAVESAKPSSSPQYVATQAKPQSNEPRLGAVADVNTATPQIGMPVTVKQVQPFVVGEARVAAVTTMAGRAATPSIIEQIVGMPASAKGRAVEVTASPTPKTNVTVVVPPALPFDPAQAFKEVDSVELPPWKESDRSILPFKTDQANLESTEQLVARSYIANEGNTSDVDRWVL